MLDDYIAQLELKNYDYTYIDMKDYPDWDCGIITKDDLYMFVKQDSLTNESVAYVNVKDANTDGITLYFDDCSRLSSFITERGQCYLYWNGEETADIHIITEDKNEIIENVAIPYFPYPETRVVWVPIFVNVARGLLVALTVKGAIDLTGDLVTGDFKGVGTDLIEMIAGGKTGKMFTDLITGYGFEGLKWSKGNYDKKLQNCLLGDCQIQVSSNKEGINNYSITVAISGYETLPVLNSITGEKSVVIAGVVVRKSFEHVNYSTNDDTLLTFQVDGNGAKTIHFELPENSVYYVAPYLLPTRYGKYSIIGGLRHGNTIRLDCFDGYIDSFKQLSYKKENGKYTFECTAHAICNAGEDHMWMLYYMDDKKMLKTYFEAKTYSEPSIGNSNTADFDFELSISADDIKEGKKNIKLGIYAYDIGLHSDPQTFVLEIECEPMTLNSISYGDDYYYFEKDGTSYIAYNCTANISGNTTVIENFSSCGIYIHASDTGDNYKWYENLSGNYNNEDIDFFIGINISKFENIDYARYYAESTNYSFGVYVEFNDGTYFYTEPKPCTFVYQREPSYKYLSTGQMTASVTGSYEDNNGKTITEYIAEYPFSYAIDGALWIENFQRLIGEGSWVFTNTGEKYGEPWTPSRDHKYDNTKTLTYNSDTSMYHTEYVKMVTKSGKTEYSNSLVYGGTPENPTVSIGGVRTSSAIEKNHSKVYNSKANTTSCGYSDGMAISDIEINKNKVMTIDDLKIIPTNKVIP